MNSSGFEFIPKPAADHFVTIRKSYKDITDGNASTAALLSVLEYLAFETFKKTVDWSRLARGDRLSLPPTIKIDGDCNFPLLNYLLDGLIKPTSLKQKLKLLEAKGLITVELKWGRKRIIQFHCASVMAALQSWAAGALNPAPSKIEPSKPESSKIEPSKSARCESSKSARCDPSKSAGCDPSRSELSKSELSKPEPSKFAGCDLSKSDSSTTDPSFSVGCDPSKSVASNGEESKYAPSTRQNTTPTPQKLSGVTRQKVTPTRSNPRSSTRSKEERYSFAAPVTTAPSAKANPQSARGLDNAQSPPTPVAYPAAAPVHPPQPSEQPPSQKAIAQPTPSSPPSDLQPLFAAGHGALWVGPKSYHWRRGAIAVAQARKRQLRQGDGVGDAQDYISNLVIAAQTSGNWSRVEKLLDEAIAHEQQAASVHQQRSTSPSSASIPSRQSQVEYVPLSQAPKDVQQKFARFKRCASTKASGVGDDSGLEATLPKPSAVALA